MQLVQELGSSLRRPQLTADTVVRGWAVDGIHEKFVGNENKKKQKQEKQPPHEVGACRATHAASDAPLLQWTLKMANTNMSRAQVSVMGVTTAAWSQRQAVGTPCSSPTESSPQCGTSNCPPPSATAPPLIGPYPGKRNPSKSVEHQGRP
jgi:hypothetical protein